MKITIILSACLYLLCPFYATSEESNSKCIKITKSDNKGSTEIIGDWKFIDARCSGKGNISKEKKAEIEYSESYRYFVDQGIVIDSVKNNCKLKNLITEKESEEIFLNIGYKFKAEFRTKMFLPLYIKNQEDKEFKKVLLFYLPAPHNNIENFECGPEEELITMFQQVL